MTKALAAIVILALVAIGVYAVYARADIPPFDPKLSWQGQVDYWKERIEKKGGEGAYTEFSDAVAAFSYGDRHSKAHAFGSALFAAEGADGISVCDARFSFGCFHQFLGDAISSLGLESIPDLNAKCFEDLAESPLSCQHGIGHGALAALGYDDAALRHALNVCEELPGADPIGGCYGGVFMEYNVRTMLAEEATTREYTGNPFSPCDTLEGAFVPACIYWQPQWWAQATLQGQDITRAYTEMGNYCRKFTRNAELLRSCFEGIGNVVAQASGFDPELARSLCDAAGETGKERLLCRAIGANHFGIDASAEAAAKVCEGLSESDMTYCMSYATNKSNVANVLSI